MTQWERRKLTALVGLAATVVALVAATPSMLFSSTNRARTTLRLNYAPNAEHAPYFLGREKGFYAAEGIDLEIEPSGGSVDAVKLVGVRRSRFGVGMADAVAIGRGRGLKVRPLAVLLQQTPSVLIAMRSTNLRQPTDLYGKRVGVNAKSSAYAFWLAFMRAARLDASRIQTLELGAAAAIGLLVNGTIDSSLVLATNEKVQLEADGYEVDVLDPARYGIRSYGQVLFTDDLTYEREPELVRRMTRATLRSWVYSIEHVDEAIAALKRAVPEANVRIEKAKWREIIPRTRGSRDGVPLPFGHQDAHGWRQTYETFRAAGLIEHEYHLDELLGRCTGQPGAADLCQGNVH